MSAYFLNLLRIPFKAPPKYGDGSIQKAVDPIVRTLESVLLFVLSEQRKLFLRGARAAHLDSLSWIPKRRLALGQLDAGRSVVFDQFAPESAEWLGCPTARHLASRCIFAASASAGADAGPAVVHTDEVSPGCCSFRPVAL
ncbi:hypothetical protein NEOLEDRAFT_1145566 [Neolentinus lepideus HHB14362 ss-1]|uniref:Uncharacterized protein n=1 Tax=Neolentinus lepideus HHB14362 ss-1 TaxID=1314782 RepID=A0A165UVT8_9AGAM|nr:hypothetical protein NEOLEDRAFT_1145566 [Neolentinus lepideus HHB14362 ss-1]